MLLTDRPRSRSADRDHHTLLFQDKAFFNSIADGRALPRGTSETKKHLLTSVMIIGLAPRVMLIPVLSLVVLTG
jgi:hypothetical protein